MSDFDKRLSALSPAAAEKLRQRLNQGAKEGRSTSQIPAYPRTSDTLPLSSAQQRLWFLDQIDPGNLAYNVPMVFPMHGEIQIPLLEKALNAMVARHEVLRTTFITRNGQPLQQIAPVLTLSLPVTTLTLTDSESEVETIQRWVNREGLIPFNLATGPMIRWHLAEITPDYHVLLVLIHHSISDGWSFNVVMREVGLVYDGLVTGTTPTLPALPIQYGDYAMWQKERLAEPEAMNKQVRYWMEALADAPPTLNLPTDFPHPPSLTHQGKRKLFRLPPALHESLQEMSRAQKATFFMTMLAAFQVLLYRYSGQSDVLVGTPVGGRTHKELENLVGFFLNTIVLRARLADNPTFAEVLEQVRTVALDGFTNQEAPFERVIEAVSPERNLSYTPLFQVMFIMENPPKPMQLGSGVRMEAISPQLDVAKFDITLAVVQYEDRVETAIEYKTHLFRDDTIERMAGHYHTLLAAIAENPQIRIDEIPLLTAAEQEQFKGWNATERTYSDVPTLHAMIETQTLATPNHVALEFEGHAITYAELNDRANALATRLIAQGVVPDVSVGVYVERSPDLLIGLLAVLKAGGAYVPLDPTYPAERLAYMLEDAAPAVLLTHAPLRDSLPPHHVPVLEIPSLSEAVIPTPNPLVEMTGDHLAYILYTSGSTGKPKGVQIPHSAVVNMLHTMQETPGMVGGESMLAATTFAFDISVVELFLPLTVGGRVVLASREVAADGVRLSALASEANVTHMQATPAGWRMLLASGWQGQADIKMFCGGEAMPSDVAEALLATGGRLWNLYGPTECTVWATMTEVHPKESITIGKPLPNTQAYILDKQLRPVPIGVVGDLYVGGAGLARGYRNRPDLTAERFFRNPNPNEPSELLYHTGDLARFLPDGNILYLGRNDGQVKLRGYRIELGEIESALGAHPNVAEAVVLLRDIRANDPALVAYIKWQGNALSLNDIKPFLRTTLPEYMLPAYVVTMSQFPLSPSGKVDRKALPTPSVEDLSAQTNYVAAESPIEEAIADVWQTLLERESIGLHDDFFAIGGHSLLATQAMARINETFDLEIPVRVLFEEPTIFNLAATIERILFDEIAALEEEEAQQALAAEEV